ncbi:MAG TPA: filamentous hemagglutinin [Cyanobacteria bacterium UBA11372]|nr:filamentous hemagglutinin [Cyanobacteria bacterium UBA11372]
MKLCSRAWKLGTISLLWLSATSSASGQIVPDRTLPNNTVVIPNGNNFQIEGGTQTGNSLFHSFGEFSVPTGGAAFFNNGSGIENIFSRVTGGNISNIDGLIRANGSANLFLLNPNGIIFGPNARLNIGGSFIGSTANSIRFGDGSSFSATNPTAPPLLTINVPIGLQFGSNPTAAIQVQGSNLAVETGQTLALLGGNLTITGSNNPLYSGLTAGGIPLVVFNGNIVPTTPGGRIELWSVLNGEVSVNNNGKLTIENGQGTNEFGNIQLLGGARVDTSGTGGGAIQVQARSLRLSEGARLSSFTLGGLVGESITVNASELVEITGTGGYEKTVLRFVTGTVMPTDLINGFFTLNFGAGFAGAITVNTPVFRLQNGAYVAATTFGDAGENANIKGVDVTINAANSLEMSAAFIAAGTAGGNGRNSGNLTVNTSRFLARDNGILTTSSFGNGRGGDITINASESVEVYSGNPISLAAISPVANAFGAVFTSGLGTGNAGDLNINTRRVILGSGAALAASSFGAGDGGDITINASDSVELVGTTPNGQRFSAITSVTELGSTGNGGNLRIYTDRLILRDKGRVSIRAQGTGDAGNLEVVANAILMDNEGGLEGTSESGVGGNFSVRSRSLVMRRNSFISATAGDLGGKGNGGNITLNTDTLAALENSDITANSVASLGGNVNITAQGIFGAQVQQRLTPESDITATGGTPALNGTVQINTPNLDPAATIVQLPENFADPSNQIVAGCAADRGNRFVVTGRGGLPSDPSQTLRGRAVWRDIRPVSSVGRFSTTQTQQPTTHNQPIIEATGWKINANGQVELVANAPQDSWYRTVNCTDR